MNEQIKIGYQTYIYDGGEDFGAVREVSPDGTQLVVYIENAGEFIVQADTVKSVLSGKVIWITRGSTAACKRQSITRTTLKSQALNHTEERQR